MTESQQFVITARAGEAGDSASLGPRREIIEALRTHNTAPEANDADDVLYGPGIRLELSPAVDPVTQMLLTITEEEIGWVAVLRLARQFKWTIIDMTSGRELNP